MRGRVVAPELAALEGLDHELLDDEGRFELVTGPSGEAELLFEAGSPGAWHLQIVALDAQDNPFFRGSTVFAVTEREPELEEVAPDMAFLAALAEQVGGRFHAPGEHGAPLEDPASGRRVEEIVETSLWDVPLVALLVGLFAPLSWWIRRVGGGR